MIFNHKIIIETESGYLLFLSKRSLPGVTADKIHLCGSAVTHLAAALGTGTRWISSSMPQMSEA